MTNWRPPNSHQIRSLPLLGKSRTGSSAVPGPCIVTVPLFYCFSGSGEPLEKQLFWADGQCLPTERLFAYLSCSCSLRHQGKKLPPNCEKSCAQHHSTNGERFVSYTCFHKRPLNTITMSTMPQTPPRWPITAGRRSSVDQGRPAEKPKSSKSKVIKQFFRSSKQDENKGDEAGRDSTPENAPNENKPAIGEKLNTNQNTVRSRNHQNPPSILTRSGFQEPRFPAFKRSDMGPTQAIVSSQGQWIFW